MNLVVAMAANYDIPPLRNFVKSFKRHQQNDILFFLQNTDDATRQWLHGEGVLTIDVEMDLHPEFIRFFALNAMLRQYPEYTRVFHCDVRDAVAQKDIFAQIPEPGLHVFLEDATIPLGENIVNRAWIERAYGAETLGRYAGKTITCSGTTLGDRESFLIYTDAVIEEYQAILARLDPEYVTYHVRDQALHMHLVYSGQLAAALEQIGKPLVLHENGDGVITLGKAREFLASKELLVCNPDKSVPAVVHQYDRHEFLQKGFDAMYAED